MTASPLDGVGVVVVVAAAAAVDAVFLEHEMRLVLEKLDLQVMTQTRYF